MRIGILALQGAFLEHRQSLERINKKLGKEEIETFEIRQLSDVEEDFDGLILPGGESTVMGKLLHKTGLYNPLKEKIEKGLPVFGTCAGLILLAKNIIGEDPHFGLLDVTVRRNAYGRQIDSFSQDALIPEISEKEIPLVFIRAPWVEKVNDSASDVNVLHELNGHITAVRQRNILATSFHPELTENTAVHEYFLNMCK